MGRPTTKEQRVIARAVQAENEAKVTRSKAEDAVNYVRNVLGHPSKLLKLQDKIKKGEKNK